MLGRFFLLPFRKSEKQDKKQTFVAAGRAAEAVEKSKKKGIGNQVNALFLRERANDRLRHVPQYAHVQSEARRAAQKSLQRVFSVSSACLQCLRSVSKVSTASL